MSLATYLQQQIDNSHMSMTAFAIKNEIHPQTISRILKEPEKRPGDKLLRSLAASKLKLSFDELKEIRDGKSPQNENQLLYGYCHDLIDESKKLNPDSALDALKLAEILCAQDRERYNPAPKYAGTPQQWKNIFAPNQHTALMFYIEKEEDSKKRIEIAGDFSFVYYHSGEIVFDENGAIAEDQIQISKLPSMTLFSGKCDVVILNMSLADRYNDEKYVNLMLDAVEEAIHDIPNKIEIENFYVNVYERDYAFYSELGFEPVWPNQITSTNINEQSDTYNIPVAYKRKNEFCGENEKFKLKVRGERE